MPASARNGAFAINFLHEDHALLALTFSGQKGVNGDDRFALRAMDDAGHRRAGADRMRSPRSTACWRRNSRPETHSIFVGEVRDVSHSLRGAPLVYLRSSFHARTRSAGPLRSAIIDSRHLSWSDFLVTPAA